MARYFFIYGELFIYLVVSILIGLQYDRYVFPLAVLMIYIVVSQFAWIGKQKKTLTVVFIVIYSLFIFKLVSTNLTIDLQWEANHFLLHEGVPSHEVNGGLGFNHFYSFDYITDLYKNVKIRRPINWYKFHPSANFFVTGKRRLENKHDGLILVKTFVKKRYFGFFSRECYIYKRKNNYSKPIWL